MYFPVGVNATFHCAVNNTHIVWVVDMLVFDSPTNTRTLHSREIFQTEAVTLDGVTRSSVTVFGNLAVNNNSRICCQSHFENTESVTNCTTLMLYGKDLK